MTGGMAIQLVNFGGCNVLERIQVGQPQTLSQTVPQPSQPSVPQPWLLTVSLPMNLGETA